MEKIDRIVAIRPEDCLAYYSAGNPVPGLPRVSHPQGKAIRTLAEALAKVVQARLMWKVKAEEPLSGLEFKSQTPYMLQTEEHARFSRQLEELNNIAKEVDECRIRLLQSGFDPPDEWLEAPVWVITSDSSVREPDDPTKPTLWRHRVFVSDIDVERVERVLCSLKSTLLRFAAMEQTSISSPSYLGLTVDRKLRRVGRAKHMAHADFSRSDAAWPVFEAIFDSAADGITPELAADAHPGGNPDAVRSTIQQIKTKLMALGVTVSNAKKDEKWKLIESGET